LPFATRAPPAGRRYNRSVWAHVYMLRCRDGSLYTGATKNLAARLHAHETGRASKYTRSRLPVTLVWWARARTWKSALREERRIKGLSRAQKLALVLSGAVKTRGRKPTRTRGARSRRPSRPEGTSPFKRP
jgi:putative endonuclease